LPILFGVQAFASDRPEYACHALLFFMERSAVIDTKPDQEPGNALPLEVSLPTQPSWKFSNQLAFQETAAMQVL